MAPRALDREHADLVAGYGEVDLVPVPICRARPVDQNALVHELTRAVLVRAEFGHPPAALELALVVVLPGEGQEELLFSVFIELANIDMNHDSGSNAITYPLFFCNVAMACSM